jgi:hypothetical protein
LVAAFLASGASALAHPPYEHNVGLIPGGDAGDVRLVKAFTDGIVLPDPVTLVLRDTQGRTLAETPVAADIAVLWPSKRRCLVFRFEHDAPLWPKDVWEVTGPQLTPRTSAWLYAIGPVVHVWNNAAEYLFVLLVPWASICGLIVTWTRMRRPWAATLSLLLVPLALLGTVLLFGALFFSNLSGPILLLLAGVATASTWRWRHLKLVRGSGPTSA